MTGEPQTPLGIVGRPHGRDGSFYVERPDHRLAPGMALTVAGKRDRLERLDGTPERPIARLSGVSDRSHAAKLRGASLLASAEDAPLVEGEWLAADLVGCSVVGLGSVRRVVSAPSCDVLEVGDEGVLVPFIGDAIRGVDSEAGVIEVDLEFVGLAEGAGARGPIGGAGGGP